MRAGGHNKRAPGAANGGARRRVPGPRRGVEAPAHGRRGAYSVVGVTEDEHGRAMPQIGPAEIYDAAMAHRQPVDGQPVADVPDGEREPAFLGRAAAPVVSHAGAERRGGKLLPVRAGDRDLRALPFCPTGMGQQMAIAATVHAGGAPGSNLGRIRPAVWRPDRMARPDGVPSRVRGPRAIARRS